MTPRFDQLVNELKKPIGIPYAQKRGTEFTNMTAVDKLSHMASGGEGRKFRQVTRGVDASMLKLAQDEAKHLDTLAKAGKENLALDKKALKNLKKAAKGI
jgi:hypothetical protein